MDGKLFCDFCGNDLDGPLSPTCDECSPGRVHVKLISIWVVHGKGNWPGAGPVIGYRRSCDDAIAFAKGRGWDGRHGFCNKVAALEAGEDVWVLSRAEPIDLDGQYDEQRETALAGLLTKGRAFECRHKVKEIAERLESLSDEKLDALAVFLDIKD